MKRIFSRISYVLYFILTGLAKGYTQNATTITGIITPPAGSAAVYTSVSLLKAADSTIVKGTASDTTGRYRFEHVPPGTYLIKATAVGYSATFSTVFTIASGSPGQTLPPLALKPTGQQLRAIEVTAAKPLIEQAAGTTVVNVAGSILAIGNSALDILRRAPGVSVDKDDNISLKGKQGVNVLIDDKPTYLSPAQLATLLRSTDGSTIQSIELLSNPSAKYDAAGSAGIINIRLKKNKKKGTNGTLMAGAGFGQYYKDNESLSLDHRQGRINLFGNFTRNDDRTAQNIDVNKLISSTQNNTYFTQHTFITGLGDNNTWRGGLDLNTGAKNTLGALVSGHFNAENDTNTDRNNQGSKPGATDSYQVTRSGIHQRYNNFAVNLNDRWNIDSSGQQLSLDADYSRYSNPAHMQHDTWFYNPDGSIRQSPASLRTLTPSVIRIRSAKADYTRPVSPTLKFDAGAKVSDVNTDNLLDARTQVAGQYVNDSLLTNHFRYDERIIAAYLNGSKSWRSIKVQAGLRAEHTTSTGTLLNATAGIVRRRYLDFFPSLFITDAITDKNEVGISYSRRIDRPGYDNLNPFIYYVDQYTYQVGNPFLRPQYTNKVELSYTYNKAVNVSFGFSRTTDVITELFVTKGDTSVDQTLNLNSQNYFDGNVNIPVKITRWWSANLDATGFYTQVQAHSLLGGELNNRKVAVQLKATQTFLIAKDLKGELTADYSSPQIMGIYTMRPYYGVNAGLSKSFAGGMFSIKAAVNDVFNTYSMIATVNYRTDNIYFSDKMETRVGRITFTYNFGTTQGKSPGHTGGAGDENGRVKGH